MHSRCPVPVYITIQQFYIELIVKFSQDDAQLHPAQASNVSLARNAKVAAKPTFAQDSLVVLERMAGWRSMYLSQSLRATSPV